MRIHSLSDIKLKNYQKFIELENTSDEDDLICLADIPRIDLYKMNTEQVEQLSQDISNVFQQQNHKFIPTFILNGVEYGFIPSLDEITYGENKDLIAYLKEWNTMHKAMSVAYRPITYKQGSKYLIEEYNGTKETSDIMLNAPLDVVLGMQVFFYNLTSELLKATLNYTLLEMMNQKKMYSQKNGVLIKNYTYYLKEILQNTKKLQNNRYTNV